jgi:hypothetical protein
MASLIYAAIASLDGYVEDEEGSFDWSMPDEELHAFVNDLERPIGTATRLTVFGHGDLSPGDDYADKERTHCEVGAVSSVGRRSEIRAMYIGAA